MEAGLQEVFPSKCIDNCKAWCVFDWHKRACSIWTKSDVAELLHGRITVVLLDFVSQNPFVLCTTFL